MDVNKFMSGLSSANKLKELLRMEKVRRGVDEESLLFVGMANVAKYYWCAESSILESRRMEDDFFASYLYDRIEYALLLGHLKELPKRYKDILNVGDEITLSEVNSLLKEREKKREEYASSLGSDNDILGVGESPELLPLEISPREVDILLKEMEERGVGEYTISLSPCTMISVSEDGKKVMVFGEDVSSEEREHFEIIAEKRGIRVADLEEFPKLRGDLLESLKAERYSSIRWNFEWEKYVVVGIPDGITDKFVYEFKTTRNKFLMGFLKPVAIAQADLYGYFFQREYKRVQIYITEDKVKETWEELVSKNKAEENLNNFSRVDEGEIPKPPRSWKCKKCEFRDDCRLLGSHV